MMYLNEDAAEIAKCNLTIQDREDLSKKFNIAFSTMAQIVAGRRKAEPEIIDTILDWTKKRMKTNIEKL